MHISDREIKGVRVEGHHKFDISHEIQFAIMFEFWFYLFIYSFILLFRWRAFNILNNSDYWLINSWLIMFMQQDLESHELLH